jgi:hypothetical protein
VIALSDLKAKDLPGLERLWKELPLGPRPLGVFRGTFLHWVDSPGARRPLVRALDTPAFVLARFGVDFDAGRWWFLHPRLQIGRFELQPGRSRWRDTEAHQLHYGSSRLPRFIKGQLYDECKQVTGSLALGLGGLNAGPGEGDHFFFALERSPAQI